MIGLFKQKSPAHIVSLFIFGLLIKLPLFLYPRPVLATENDGKLYQYFIAHLSIGTGQPLVASLLAFGFLYIQALMVNYLVNEYRLTAKQSFLPAMSYLLVTSLLPEWSYLSASMVAATLIIWAFIKLFRLYNVAEANTSIYNIGLLIGLASFIFFPSLLFVVCILLGLLILRPFRLNELFLFITGALTPFYFFAVYLFLTDRPLIPQLIPKISLEISQIKGNIWLAVSTVLLIIPFLIGGFYIQTHLRKMLIQVRKNWSIVLLYLLIALFIPFINNTHSFHNWVLVAAPFAAFHACAYLYPPRKWLPVALFWATVLAVVLQQYVVHSWQ